MATHLLRKSAALFADMMAERQSRAVARPVAARSSIDILADIDARLARPAAELPSLIGALAMRGAICGAHRAEVAA